MLGEGKWFKIAITENGVYRIDFAMLKKIGLANPSLPRLYGNNNGQLPYYNGIRESDDLREISIFLEKGNDGVFNEGDFMFFYGENTSRWIFDYNHGQYNFLKHNYSDTAFYFLTSGNSVGKIIQNTLNPEGTVNYFSSESDALYNYEKEQVNLIKSGREWFQPLSYATEKEIDPMFEEIIAGEAVKFEIRVIARAPVPVDFSLLESESMIGTISVPAVNLSSNTGAYAQSATLSAESLPLSASPKYKIRFINKGDISAKGWLDYVRIQGRKRNVFKSEVNLYTDSRSVLPGNITEFQIESSAGQEVVWDVTDPYNIKEHVI